MNLLGFQVPKSPDAWNSMQMGGHVKDKGKNPTGTHFCFPRFVPNSISRRLVLLGSLYLGIIAASWSWISEIKVFPTANSITRIVPRIGIFLVVYKKRNKVVES